MTGRGRLYQRARARGESLQTLRDTALARLVRLLRLEPDTEREALVEAVVAQSGWPAPLVFGAAFAASELVYPLLFPWYYAASVHKV